MPPFLTHIGTNKDLFFIYLSSSDMGLYIHILWTLEINHHECRIEGHLSL